MQKIKNQSIFWDYNIDKIDLKNPKIKTWYLERKLKFGDFSGISKKDLKKYISKINIDSSLKQLIKNFLKKYA